LQVPAQAFRLGVIGAELLNQVRRLGKEFVRRGMRQEASLLRLYYLALRSGLIRSPLARMEAVSWSRAQTEEWLRLLRMPPWDHVYELRSRGVPCFRFKPATLVEQNPVPGLRPRGEPAQALSNPLGGCTRVDQQPDVGGCEPAAPYQEVVSWTSLTQPFSGAEE
jgi:hypothetical protein